MPLTCDYIAGAKNFFYLQLALAFMLTSIPTLHKKFTHYYYYYQVNFSTV